MRYILLLLISFSCFTLGSCRKNTIEPMTPPVVPKTVKEYIAEIPGKRNFQGSVYFWCPSCFHALDRVFPVNGTQLTATFKQLNDTIIYQEPPDPFGPSPEELLYFGYHDTQKKFLFFENKDYYIYLQAYYYYETRTLVYIKLYSDPSELQLNAKRFTYISI